MSNVPTLPNMPTVTSTTASGDTTTARWHAEKSPVNHEKKEIKQYAYFQHLKNYLENCLGSEGRTLDAKNWLQNCYFTSKVKVPQRSSAGMELTKVTTQAAEKIYTALRTEKGCTEEIPDVDKWFYDPAKSRPITRKFHSFYSYQDPPGPTIFGCDIPGNTFEGFYGSPSVPGNSSSGGNSTASPCQSNEAADVTDSILNSMETLTTDPSTDLQKHLLTLAETRGHLRSLNCPTKELRARRDFVFNALSQKQNELVGTLRATTETQIENIIVELMGRCTPIPPAGSAAS
jgi:hypothetical protein